MVNVKSKPYYRWALPVGLLMNLIAALIAGFFGWLTLTVFMLTSFGQLLVLRYGGLES